jgi:hypothetical protein
MIEGLAIQLLAEGRFGLALEAAIAALRADDLRESADCTVIRVHVAEGNMAEARWAYETCRVVLQRGGGLTPSPETARLLTART